MAGGIQGREAPSCRGPVRGLCRPRQVDEAIPRRLLWTLLTGRFLPRQLLGAIG